MNIGIKIAIVVISIIVVLSIIGSVVISRANHHEYCHNWLNGINKEKQDLSAQLFPDSSSVIQLNEEVSNYNHECAY